MDYELLRAVGMRIRELRLSRGLSQADLSRMVGCGLSYIGEIERGRRNISISLLGAILDALDGSPADFFDSELFANGFHTEQNAMKRG